MLTIIQDEGSIARYQKLLLQRFRPFMDKKIAVKIGHMGASFKAKIAWSDRLGIWMYSSRGDENRYWNVFGLGRPTPDSHVTIASEINFPARGIDRKIGAAFARDHEGRVFVVHRGKIGGGRKGVGKSLFESQYRGLWADVEDGDTEATLAIVGLLSSPRFPLQAAQFIHKIAKIKDVVTSAASSQTTMSLESWQFSEELTGERFEDLRRDLARKCDHGLIVRDLAHALKALGYRVGNDTYRDLFIIDRDNHIAAVFQIITDTHLKSIHEGVTHLFFSGLSLRQPCRLLLALPDPIEAALEERLKRINIETITYEWQEQQAAFPGIDNIMKSNKNLYQ